MKQFFINSFSYYKNVDMTNITKKTKQGFKKRLMKGIKIFMMKKKTKSLNMLQKDIEIFLKKEKTKNISMVMNNVKIFLKMKSEV